MLDLLHSITPGNLLPRPSWCLLPGGRATLNLYTKFCKGPMFEWPSPQFLSRGSCYMGDDKSTLLLVEFEPLLISLISWLGRR
jgi:hypothetical protein